MCTRQHIYIRILVTLQLLYQVTPTLCSGGGAGTWCLIHDECGDGLYCKKTTCDSGEGWSVRGVPAQEMHVCLRPGNALLRAQLHFREQLDA
jgi:hypothetical protein